MPDTTERLEQLFIDTGRAHHKATGGTNVDWAIWYADYLYEKIPSVLGRVIHRSELIYALMLLSKKQPVEAPEARWSRYYAEYFAKEYAEA